MKIWDEVMDLGKECSAGLSSMRWKEIQQVITVSSSEYTNTNRIQLCYSVPYGRLQWVFTVKETCQTETHNRFNDGSNIPRPSEDTQRVHIRLFLHHYTDGHSPPPVLSYSKQDMNTGRLKGGILVSFLPKVFQLLTIWSWPIRGQQPFRKRQKRPVGGYVKSCSDGAWTRIGPL